MAQTTVLTTSQYSKLVADIRSLIVEGRERADQAAARELVQTYWAVGKRITQDKLTQRAGYGDSVMEDLAEELDVHADTLRQSVRFFEVFKNKDPRVLDLPWAHYRVLMRLPDAKARTFYEQQASAEGWRRDDLVKAIEGARYEKASGKFRVGAKTLRRPTEGTYLYHAEVSRVVDGDTLLLRIDLGFAVWKEQRVRLAGIDTPAMDSAKGRQAFEYVRDRLAKAMVVMVKTHQIDIYGRYVGHVFYAMKEAPKGEVFVKGKYLNEELVQRGLAKVL